MSIRLKLIASFIWLALLAPLIGTASLYLYRDASETAAITEAKNIALTTAQYIVSREGRASLLLSAESREELEKFVLSMHNRLKRDFEIVDMQGDIIADVIAKDIGTTISFPEVKETLKDGIIRTFIEVSKDYPQGIRQIVVPITNYSDMIVGAVILEYTPLYLELAGQAKKGAIIIALVSFLCFVMVIGTGSFVANKLAHPIIVMKEAVEKIALGNLNERVHVKAKDEIGKLADAFNTMAAKLKETQEELVRREKLAILGKIAGSVGHEIRNPLGVISNAVFYLNTVIMNADENTKEYLNIIKDEVTEAERIVSDLLDFARTKTPQKRATVVSELITGSLTKFKIPENIRLVSDISETLHEITVDPMQMTQVFVNIIKNAVDAMPDGGDIRITAAEDKGEGTLHIAVADTGPGISPEHTKRLFQPLFTTKARGLGLGLTIVKNLTEANGGKVEAESEQGKGTVFKVVVPIGIT